MTSDLYRSTRMVLGGFSILIVVYPARSHGEFSLGCTLVFYHCCMLWGTRGYVIEVGPCSVSESVCLMLHTLEKYLAAGAYRAYSIYNRQQYEYIQ